MTLNASPTAFRGHRRHTKLNITGKHSKTLISSLIHHTSILHRVMKLKRFGTKYYLVGKSTRRSRKQLTDIQENPIAIPSSRLVDLNHNSEEDAEWVRDPAGSESILALPEVFVQLGCINFLRQLSYSNERDYTHLACFQGGSSVVWQRAYQCLERLRQMVMCWADTSVILQEYDPDPPEGQEGRLLFHMDSYHRCRDFDRIKKWTENNAVENVTMNNLWWGGRMQE